MKVSCVKFKLVIWRSGLRVCLKSMRSRFDSEYHHMNNKKEVRITLGEQKFVMPLNLGRNYKRKSVKFRRILNNAKSV